MLPFELTKDTPYLALSGELWSVFYEYFNRNWPCYKGFLLYWYSIVHMQLKGENQHTRDKQCNLAQTTQKFLAFDAPRTDFADIKHGYTRDFTWSVLLVFHHPMSKDR